MLSNKVIVGIAVVVLILGGGYLLSRSQSSSVVSAPTSTTTTGNTGSSYTLAEIQTHNTDTNCWSAINGSVYDLTSWISRHPGGEGPIKGMCGTDGTAAYTGQHGNSRRPASALALLKIGTLK